MRRPVTSLLMVLFGLVLSTVTTRAQVSERRLTSDAEFPEGFSLVAGLREMPDGRLMISDAIGQMLMFADMDTGEMEIIGREGRGPQEYRTPDALFPLPGDSTLFVDLGNGRLTVLGPNGGFGETRPIARDIRGQLVAILPRGVDAQGRVYFQPLAFGGGRPGAGLPDSAMIARWDRRTDVIDTLGAVKLEERIFERSGSANNQSVRLRQVPMSSQDAWNVAPNGRVVVARSPEYYVEWIGDGAHQRGPTVDFDPVRVRTAEKESWVESRGRGGLRIGVTIENGVRQMSFGRGAGNSDRPDISGYEWPETMPAFTTGAAVNVDLNGNAWVRRSVRIGNNQVYDVFGADGELAERIILPAGRQVVGFGENTVYAVYFDEFDLQWLERYPM